MIVQYWYEGGCDRNFCSPVRNILHLLAAHTTANISSSIMAYCDSAVVRKCDPAPMHPLASVVARQILCRVCLHQCIGGWFVACQSMLTSGFLIGVV